MRYPAHPLRPYDVATLRRALHTMARAARNAAMLRWLREHRRASAEQIIRAARRLGLRRYLEHLVRRAPVEAARRGFTELSGRLPRNFRLRPAAEMGRAPSPYAVWTARSRWFKHALKEEAEEIGEVLLRACRELSSWRFFSLEELRELGHPYSTRFPPGSAGIPDYIVNFQSGEFWRSWFMQAQPAGDDRILVWVDNHAYHAPFLFYGTRKMRRRPIVEAAAIMTRDERRRALQRLRERIRRRRAG